MCTHLGNLGVTPNNQLHVRNQAKGVHCCCFTAPLVTQSTISRLGELGMSRESSTIHFDEPV